MHWFTLASVRTLALAGACALPLAAFAADSKDAGAGWVRTNNHLGVQVLTTPGIDRDWVEVEDMQRFETGEPVTRFAIKQANRITPATDGTWDQPSATVKRWQIVLKSPEAVSINLGFTRYVMPAGGTLTMLDKSGKAQFRSFTAADNDDHGQLWTPLVEGDEVTLVLTVPTQDAAALELELTAINHGYRGLGETPWFAKSGSCNVDVICPQGDDWREEIRSVAALTLNGVDQCTGALVNNVNQDLKAYFLTAAHCQFNNNTAAAGMVAYWNFENSTCRVVGSPASGGAGDGTRTQFNTGAIFRATRAQSDFTLVEFDDPIDPAFNVFWAGIDARDQITASAVGIHHPGVDEKRISFENQPTQKSSYNATPDPGDGTHLRVVDWDLGTTEGGSSGSPLFSPEKRIVGQLHGGGAACGNDLSDYYGRVAVSWATGTTPATQLKAWLDPGNTGTLIIDGRNRVEAPFDVKLVPNTLEACALDGNATVAINVTQEEAGFVDPVALTVTGVPAGATGTITPPSVIPGNSASLVLSNLVAATPGNSTVSVTGVNGADSVTSNLALSLFTAVPGTPTLSAPANGATSVSTSANLSWTAVAQAQSYRVQVATDAAFATIVSTQTVTTTSVTVNGLGATTQYFWRVTAINACDDGVTSAARNFTTGAEYCSTTVVPITDNVPAGVTSTISVPTSANLTDLNVVFEGTHTYIGDLKATLTHGATTRILLDRPGFPATQFGCSGDNPNLTLDDAATQPVETSCVALANPGFPPGSYVPTETLAAFNATDITGTWTLNVSDNAAGDTGSITRWCLLPATAPTVNVPPVAGTIADQTVNAGTAFTLNTSTAFSDANGDTLTYSATNLPAWATLNPTTGVITGTPAPADAGAVSVTITATEDDPAAGTASTSFMLTVVEVNVAPTVTPIPDTDAPVGVAFTLDAGSYFDDANDDVLTYQAFGLPAWASIDPVTGIITGTPGPGDIGSTNVTVRAREPAPTSLQVQDVFVLRVIAPLAIEIFADDFED